MRDYEWEAGDHEVQRFNGYLYPKSCTIKTDLKVDRYSVHTAENQANGAIAYLGVEWEIKLVL